MKIAIDVSPLESGHKVRGVGFYLQHLKDALEKYFPEHQYLFFKDKKELQGDIDLIHYPYFDPFFLTLPFIKQYPTVVTVHDLTPLIFPQHFPAGIKGQLRWHLQKYNLKKVDMILTDSYASKKDILKLVDVPEEKVSVVHLAAGEEFKKINEQKIKELKNKYDLPEKFVLYVGDVTWNKNVPRLVKVVKELNIPLVLVGKALAQKDIDVTNPWNHDLLEVQELIKDDKRVKVLGFVSSEDLVALYNAATVFVFPSVYEGFGLPILEAMQSGCPVIISKESCMPEIGGDAANYFDGYSESSLAESINKVFNDTSLQKELSEKGFIQAKKFSWEKTADEVNAIYKKSIK